MPKDDNKKPQTTEGENKDVQTPEDTTLGTAETETPQADEEMTAETVTEELCEEELMEEKPKIKPPIKNSKASINRIINGMKSNPVSNFDKRMVLRRYGLISKYLIVPLLYSSLTIGPKIKII